MELENVNFDIPEADGKNTTVLINGLFSDEERKEISKQITKELDLNFKHQKLRVRK